MVSKCPCGKHEYNPTKQFCYWEIDDVQLFEYNKNGKPTGKYGLQEIHQHPVVVCTQ